MSEAFKHILARLAEGRELQSEQAGALVEACLSGAATPVQIAAALTALHLRGETVDELTGGARALRRASLTFDPGCEVLDTCGTGGDGAHTYNISTAVAFVVAAAGVKVAKHGGRAVSSRSGSAEILAVLGVATDRGAEHAKAQLAAAGICFLNAPTYHPALARVASIRADLGFRTLFNLLGPLANPAGARRQVMGVYDPLRVEPMARVLGELGAHRAWVVHGGGLDELTLTGPSVVAEWRDGQVRRLEVAPEDAGLPRTEPDALAGGDAAQNAEALLAIFDGAPGAYRDVVVLNAAAALVVSDRVATLAEGAALAVAELDGGGARRVLQRLVAMQERRQ